MNGSCDEFIPYNSGIIYLYVLKYHGIIYINNWFTANYAVRLTNKNEQK